MIEDEIENAIENVIENVIEDVIEDMIEDVILWRDWDVNDEVMRLFMTIIHVNNVNNFIVLFNAACIET